MQGRGILLNKFIYLTLVDFLCCNTNFKMDKFVNLLVLPVVICSSSCCMSVLPVWNFDKAKYMLVNMFNMFKIVLFPR